MHAQAVSVPGNAFRCVPANDARVLEVHPASTKVTVDESLGCQYRGGGLSLVDQVLCAHGPSLVCYLLCCLNCCPPRVTCVNSANSHGWRPAAPA